jgi:hypothetical protein
MIHMVAKDADSSVPTDRDAHEALPTDRTGERQADEVYAPRRGTRGGDESQVDSARCSRRGRAFNYSVTFGGSMEPRKRMAKLSTVATFPKGFFLENLAVRSDNSLFWSHP